MSDQDIADVWKSYCDFVKGHAERIYYETILPWLVDNSYEFTVEGDKWFVTMPKGYFVEIYEMPDSIVSILREEVPGFPGRNLGTFMPSTKKKKGKKADAEEW